MVNDCDLSVELRVDCVGNWSFKAKNVEEAVEIRSYSTGFPFRTHTILFNEKIKKKKKDLNSITVRIRELVVKLETLGNNS